MPRILLLSPLPNRRRTTPPSRRRSFPPRGRVELPLHRRRTRSPRLAGATWSSGSRARGGRRWRQYRSPSPQRPVQCVVGHWPAIVIGVQLIADQRRAISGFGVGLTPSATKSPPEVVQHAVNVSLGIVGHNGRGMHDKTLRSSRYYVGSIPTGFRVGAGFDSDRAIVETETAWGVPAGVGPPVLFLPANTARHLVGISVGIGRHQR
jgi:hypothetical protein